MTPITGKDLLRLLRKAGFEVVYIKGSHHKLVHPDGRQITLPVHGNRDLKQGTLRSILQDVGWSRQDYEPNRTR